MKDFDRAEEWLFAQASESPQAISKQTEITRAWFAKLDGTDYFVKFYPPDRLQTWASVERSVSGAGLHSAIVRLEETLKFSDGELFLYRRVNGENFGDSDVRKRFLKLKADERATAILMVIEAVSEVSRAGFVVVDWYEGNMIYDFDNRRMWLFDWELCRPGIRFTLEMDSNYGASRLMAPEEFVKGSAIDEKTLQFNLGRFALLYLPDLADSLGSVLSRATHPSKVGRYKDLRHFLRCFRRAIDLALE